eukprot:Nk52_evm58s745 gene=Nk52_evmTU58s745
MGDSAPVVAGNELVETVLKENDGDISDAPYSADVIDDRAGSLSEQGKEQAEGEEGNTALDSSGANGGGSLPHLELTEALPIPNNEDGASFMQRADEQEEGASFIQRNDEQDDFVPTERKGKNVDIPAYKIVLLGDGGVGKTALCRRFVNEVFNEEKYVETRGLDLYYKTLSFQESDYPATNQAKQEVTKVSESAFSLSSFLRMLPTGDMGKKEDAGKKEVVAPTSITFEFIDIPGRKLGNPMLANIIFRSDVVIYAYDICDYQSFQHVFDWYDFAQRICSDRDHTPVECLLALKADHMRKRTVNSARHFSLCKELGLQSYFITSASSMLGDITVEMFFFELGAILTGASVPAYVLEQYKKWKLEKQDSERDAIEDSVNPKSNSGNLNKCSSKNNSSKTCTIL